VDSNASWRRAHDAVGLSLQEEAQRWEAAGRPTQSLLDGARLQKARAWRNGPGAEVWRAGGLIREYIEASESQRNRKRLLIYGFLGIVALCGAVVLLFSNIQAMQARDAARDAQRFANDQRTKAEQTQLIERGVFASSLIAARGQRSRQFDALAWGIKAMGAALKSRTIPTEARKGLQDAVAPVANATLFVTSPRATPQFFPDGRSVLTSSSGDLRVIDVATGNVRWKPDRLAADVENFTTLISADSAKILATASVKQNTKAPAIQNQEEAISKRTTRRVWLLDVATKEILAANSVADMSGGFFDWNGSHIVVWKAPENDQYLIRVLDAKSLAIVRQLESTGVQYLTISPDSKTLATLMANGTIELWRTDDEETRPRTIPLKGIKVPASPTLSFTPDGQRIVLGDSGANGFVWIFDATTGGQLAEKETLPHGSPLFPPDSTNLYVSNAEKILIIDGGTAETKALHDFSGDDFFLSQDLNRVLRIHARTSEQPIITVLELGSGNVSALPSQTMRGSELAVSSDLELAATVDAEGIGRIFPLSKTPPDLAKLSDADLLGLACSRLRDRIDHHEVTDEEVIGVCRDPK